VRGDFAVITGTPRQYLAPAPAERLAALRVLVVSFTLAYLLIRLPHLLDVVELARSAPDRFRPVGPLTMLDAPVSRTVALAGLAATIVVGGAALVGWRWRVSGPLFALGALIVLSYRNSWGQVFHTENLVVIHLAILALSPAADAWTVGARGRAERSPRPAYGWPAQLMVVSVVVAYVLAGWAKVRVAGLGWAGGDALANLVGNDALRKELVGSSASPVARVALRVGWVFAPMAAFSLVVELAAPIALLGGRWRVGWAIAALVFHVGVLAVMGILFPYQLLGVAFAAFVTVESIPDAWRHRRRRRARRAILAP
jgi:hypothetical protein